MFERLVNDVANRLTLSSASVMSVLKGLLGMFTNPSTGGLAGVVDQFKRIGLGDTVTSWFGGGGTAAAVTPSQVESALGRSTIERLATSAGLSPSSAGSAAAALLPSLVGQLTPGGVLPSTNGLLSQVQQYLPSIPSVEDVRRGLPRWLPWVAVAALALLAFLWLRPSPATIDPRLSITNTNGRITYSGVVRDDQTRRTVGQALATAFGAANVSGDLQVDANVKTAPWLSRIADIVATLKVPGVEFSLDGLRLSLGGWLSNADRQSLTTRLAALFGSETTIGRLGDRAGEAVTAANARATAALAALGTATATGDVIVRAMNLAIVNFPTGSADLPPDSANIVARSAEALKRAPKGTRVEVAGHTDNVGDPAANLKLSQAIPRCSPPSATAIPGRASRTTTSTVASRTGGSNTRCSSSETSTLSRDELEWSPTLSGES